MTKEIPLTQGYVAIVDDEDYEMLSKYKWCYSSTIGYAVSRERVNGKKVVLLMHRLVNNTPKHLVTDHINRNKLDNRRCNLRSCTKAENNINMAIRSNNKSGYRGVYWHEHKNKWQANIRKNNKSLYLGLFEDVHEAARMYNFWAVDLFGEYAQLNIIKEGA